MVQYTTTILKFTGKGEKTGWTYIEIPIDIAEQLKPNNKKSFRVKGKLDNYPIKMVATLPIGDSGFVIAINASMRKGIGKRHGALLHVELEEDTSIYELNKDLMECLTDEQEALDFFNSLSKSHQNYFSKWIDGAKTENTKAKRIAQTVTATLRKKSYSEMIRSLKKKF